ncbi:hypothetical protein BB780_11870 [Stenotrophomonas maltophilia]|nr:hypothetical protein BB780_11870 [Stenotrophomonas maltophilia]
MVSTFPCWIGIRTLVVLGYSLGAIAIVGHVVLLPFGSIIAPLVRRMGLRLIIHVRGRIEGKLVGHGSLLQQEVEACGQCG